MATTTDAWAGSWGSSWASSWTSTIALDITDTDILQLPVDYQLHGRPPLIAGSGRTIEPYGGKAGIKRLARGSGGFLTNSRPSFTVTTNKKGYD